MPAYYLVPTESATLLGQPATVPEYLSTFVGTWTSLPYGSEPLALVCLASDNPTLDAADDVFSFPADLSQVLSDDAISSISDFFGNANIPFSSFTSGTTTWQAVLLQTAQVFLLAQAISAAASGQPIFTDGVTLDSTVGTQNQSAGKVKSGGSVQQTPSALATAAGSVVGPYDLTGVDTSETVEDTLILISSQFASPILLGAAGAI